jgi:two-component system chemotaxis sensor kinase CheA
MSNQNTNEAMLEMFLFETSQLIEQLEQLILSSDKENYYSNTSINEIFRIMHTIKGSAAMMMYQSISALAHSIEDIFFYLRDEKPKEIDCSSLTDLILESVDFIKVELEKIRNNDKADGDARELINSLRNCLSDLKMNNSNNSEQKNPAVEVQDTILSFASYYIHPGVKERSVYQNTYQVDIFFEEGCEMENVRAYSIIHKLKEQTECFAYYPGDILDSDRSIGVIRQKGFRIFLKANSTYQEMQDFFLQTIFIKSLDLIQYEDDSIFDSICRKGQDPLANQRKEDKPLDLDSCEESKQSVREGTISSKQSIISVNVAKLDKLMDLVGELVIAEAMVIQNPDLKGLELTNFQKAARQLNKITSEIQDTVMAVRMVPLSTTFHKMNRIVRDMCRKMEKEVRLKIIGEETEVDKNIIEHISDPLMHLVRNAIDHGIEEPELRKEKGKPKEGTLTLEAKNSGNDVLIIVQDDGKGLNKDRILKKASEHGLLLRNEEDMSDTEIYNLILMPGFSTKNEVTEYSGRGVGMDVVTKNIEAIGGSISIHSRPGRGTSFILKIPLTLAIIDGMNIKVGSSCYTLPTIAIKESFRPRREDIIIDPNGNEMIMVRGQCYPILRLHDFFKVKTEIHDFTAGIIIMVEQDNKTIGIFADELLGQQQVVVKGLPEYIKRFKKIRGLTGCTLLGDGRISLILDVAGLINGV